MIWFWTKYRIYLDNNTKFILRIIKNTWKTSSIPVGVLSINLQITRLIFPKLHKSGNINSFGFSKSSQFHTKTSFDRNEHHSTSHLRVSVVELELDTVLHTQKSSNSLCYQILFPFPHCHSIDFIFAYFDKISFANRS